MAVADAPFTAKGIAPFLARTNPERAAACERVTSLIVNLGSGAKIFAIAGELLPPLLALLPEETAAAGPLATFADPLTRVAAYPEASACIDAVIDRDSAAPLGMLEEPWLFQAENEKMTWPRQQALLWLWRGEARLAAGDREGGNAAFAEGARRAEAAAMPARFGLLGSRSPFVGTVADRRLWALTRAARALRLRSEGKDPCDHRKTKNKANPGADPAQLALARAYLAEVLAAIGARIETDRATGWHQFAHDEAKLVGA